MDHTVTSCLGYAAILTGCLFEGETVLVAAGWAAQGGYLSLPLVLLSAWLGAVSGDHLFFMLGRYKGSSMFGLLPSWSPKNREGPRTRRKIWKPSYLQRTLFVRLSRVGSLCHRHYAHRDRPVRLPRPALRLDVDHALRSRGISLRGCHRATPDRCRFLTALSIILPGCIAFMIYRRSIARETSRMAKNVQVHFGAAGRLLRTLRLSHGT